MIMTDCDLNSKTIRDLERASLRAFMEKHRGYLKGRVLDFGAGKPGTCREPQPYGDLVDGEYFPYEKGDPVPMFERGVRFDAIICTQVLQYVSYPRTIIGSFAACLNPGGYLVMTLPTCWDEVEETDKWRFTKAGIESLLIGWEILHHERRAEINLGGFRFPLGYGVVARVI